LRQERQQQDERAGGEQAETLIPAAICRHQRLLPFRAGFANDVT
jgi:hypothetical protein